MPVRWLSPAFDYLSGGPGRHLGIHHLLISACQTHRGTSVAQGPRALGHFPSRLGVEVAMLGRL
jgi:hypothetical protein